MTWLTFMEVLETAAYAVGLDPRHNLQENMAAPLCRYIEKRVRAAWRFCKWPDLCRTEQRAFRQDWNAETEYASGTEVYDPATDCYYAALVPTVGTPVSSADTWKTTKSLDRFVALDQPGKTRIGDPLNAYRRNPAESENPEPLAFSRSENGIQFKPGAPNRVWITFRLPTPKFSTARMDRNEPGELGDVYFNPDDGRCYRVRSIAADWPPTIVGAELEPQDIPEFLKDAVVAGVHADYLREDGEYSKAALQETEAGELLQDEGSQLNNQQRQTQRYSVRVY